MQQNSNFSNPESQIKESSQIPINAGIIPNSQFSQQETQNNPQLFQNNPNKIISKPIGIYNFNRNKSDITSLEESIDEVVSSFIENNKENIIKYVVNEVQVKLKEKIQPLNSEINDIKTNFNLLYSQELKDFKELDILNECHNNIININNKVNLMNENINKYNDEIKGFNIADNRLQFLNKLNKNLEEFIHGINHENDKNMDIYFDEENCKIDFEQKKQDNTNQELDIVFNETLALLIHISNDEKSSNKNLQPNNNFNFDVSNDLKNAIINFENKFNYEKPIYEEESRSKNNNCLNINKKEDNLKNNVLDSIPDFFELNF